MQCQRPVRIACWLVLATGCGRGSQALPGALPDAGGEHADAWPWANAETTPPPPDALGPDGLEPDARVPPPAPDALPPSACNAAETAPLRRLTTTQYLRTVRELTGVTVTTAFGSSPTVEGADDRVDSQNIDLGLVSAWRDAAEEVATALAAKVPALTGCTTIDDACARSFVTRFGLRAYRRPLTAAEVDAHFKVYAQVKMLGDASDGILAVLRVMLQSPHLLFRPEIVGGGVTAGRLSPSPWETATRLSYFLWGNMPDAALFDAATKNQLASVDQVTAQIQRMLLDPRARQGTNDFIRQWLSVDRVLDVQKDAMTYPAWNPALAAAMREEAYRFSQRVIFDGDGRLSTLLTSTDGIVNGPIAQLYGVTITGTDWQDADLSKQNRFGLLTQGWFLAGRGRPLESSPAARGVLLRERLFCQAIPPPPPNVDPPPPIPMPGTTTRERYQSQLVEPACAGCHNLFDGLGFPFESYDGIGAFRTADNGKPVDSSGEINGTTSTDGKVVGAADLIRRLAASPDVRDCVAHRWYQLAVGRQVDLSGDCRSGELKRWFRGGPGNLRDLVASIALSTARMARPASEVSSTAGAPLIVAPGDQRTMQKIVLDQLGTQVASLRQRLALSDDRLRLDQHLQGLRELEKRLASAP